MTVNKKIIDEKEMAVEDSDVKSDNDFVDASDSEDFDIDESDE